MFGILIGSAGIRPDLVAETMGIGDGLTLSFAGWTPRIVIQDIMWCCFPLMPCLALPLKFIASAVVFAGATVIIALAGLSVVGIPFLATMGLAAAATVLVAVLVALTLSPAMLGFAGRRVLVTGGAGFVGGSLVRRPVKGQTGNDRRVVVRIGSVRATGE